ncbi:CheR family methyltransferase [Salmonirosea aquatica]|uniref:PAS domain-containing protein n=1 Tax=Salmonirosea aquatica TaxID=2654236 RepID=A0A7C9BEV1_9BACT|nr:PAS domain-containing protein [Cytophagaceae bacterium SJW1-29]
MEDREDIYVVGVGASAGGLDALSRLLSKFNGNTHNFCVVIVQHLSPDYKSELTSILRRRCKWPVEKAEDGTHVAPHRVYVTPQNCSILIHNGTLLLEKLPRNYSNAPSIDTFLNSLALDKKQKAIGVIMSGFGQDGSKGIQAIKQAGGFTLIQDPASAEHKDMPMSALATGHVDRVLEPAVMYEEITHYINNHTVLQSSNPRERSVDAIFDLLAQRSGTDFSQYKSSTIMRRMDKRVEALNLPSYTDYYKMIRQNPKELDVLFDTVLIGITEFFRNKDYFDSLANELELLLGEKKSGDSIRVWCVGCATGEEPYTVAILLSELLGSTMGDYQLQIFGSDIDERALSAARKGVYAAKDLKHLPEEIMARYFEKTVQGGGYQVRKTLKKYVLFSKHDITNDPPFVKLDLITCRNLFIYFNSSLQKETLKVFHYALVENGLLFLGKSENISSASDLFMKINKHKIFKKVSSETTHNLNFSRRNVNYAFQPDMEKKAQSVRNMSIIDIAKETLYHTHENPFVIINEQAEIKEVQGSLRLYLEISQGAMNSNLLKMSNQEMTLEIRGLLARVKKTGKLQVGNVIRFTLFEKEHFVRIKIMPFIYPTGEMDHFIVMFEQINPGEHYLMLDHQASSADFVDFRIKELEQELSMAREYMHTFTEELETSNEELQSLNEELQSANEELKSSNEEMETSNEELQSANEELNTANNELRISNEMIIEREAELKVATDELRRNETLYRTISENIPNGTVGILNEKHEIEYIAGKGLEQFKIDPRALVGQNLPDLNPSSTQRKLLKKTFRDTLAGKSCTIEFSYTSHAYSLHTIPLKLDINSSTNKILFLSQEITEKKLADNRLKLAIEASRLITYDYDITSDRYTLSPDFYTFFELEEDESIGLQSILPLIHPDDLPIRDAAYADAMESGELKYEARLVLKSGIKWMKVFGRIINDTEGKPQGVIGAILDSTADHVLLDKIKESEERFRIIANSAPVKIWMSDQDKRFTYFNSKWLAFTGRTLDQELGDGWLESVHPEDRAQLMADFNAHFDRREPFVLEYRMMRHDGTYRIMQDDGVPRFSDGGVFEGYIGSCVDITDKKQFTDTLEQEVQLRTEQLKESNQKLYKVNLNLEQFAYIASHDMQEPLRKIQMFIALMQKNLSNEEKALAYSQKVASAADRMAALITNILEYSRVSSEDERFEELDLNTIIDEIVVDCELLIQEKNAELIYGDLGKIWGVEIQLYQLFINLVKNSLKFNEGKPIIRITTEEMEGKSLKSTSVLDPERTYKMIRIQDNGIGFKEEYSENIFEMFKRLNSKDKYVGTGIGLALCRKIVEMHHGYIEAASHVGEGATFTLYLPVQNR